MFYLIHIFEFTRWVYYLSNKKRVGGCLKKIKEREIEITWGMMEMDFGI